MLSFCDEWAFIMDPHITTVTLNCFVTLWDSTTAKTSQLYSSCNTKLRHQIQFLRVRRHQGLSMKRGSVFRIPQIQWDYPMPYSTFCKSHIETDRSGQIVKTQIRLFQGLVFPFNLHRLDALLREVLGKNTMSNTWYKYSNCFQCLIPPPPPPPDFNNFLCFRSR